MRTPLPQFALVIGLAIIVIGGAGYWHSLQSMNPETYEIVLTENGFIPQEITIARGDIVIFTTIRQKSFWPASNLHPTHDIYPEFDSREPIETNTSWSFTFDKKGEWKYHDHLSPLFRGTIRVRNRDQIAGRVAASQENNKSCTSENYAERTTCRENVIFTTLASEGIGAAYKFVSAYAQDDSQFAVDCHDISHRIGEEAYALFAKRVDFELSPKTSYCAYGFYHGFMEALLHDGKDAREAALFCAYAQDKLGEETAYAEGACYHGIGHGAVEDEPNPKSWGNAEKIIEPSLALCEKVAANDFHLFLCTSGVFNALEIISTAGKYGLSLNTNDPFRICRTQPEKYKRACFTQFLIAAMHAAQNDFLKTARFINTISEDAYAEETLVGLAIERVHLGMTDHKKTLEACHALPERFLLPCITGFAEGFLKYGPPEKEHEGALSFCNSPLLAEEERIACFARILSILRIWYPQEKSKEICMSADEKYRWNRCEY